MSKEEAAVRKALAAVQADTGLAQAQEIIKTGTVPASVTSFFSKVLAVEDMPSNIARIFGSVISDILP